MRRQMRLSVVSLVVGIMAGVSFGAAVPFTDSFEGGSVGADWNTNGAGVVAIAVGDATPGGGADSCSISNDAIQIDVTSVNNVWAQIYTKAAGYDGDPASTQIDGLSAVFFVTKTGELRVMDGDGANGGTWTNVATGISLSGNKTGWLGFVVHIDYVDKKWDIYQQTSGQTGEAVLTRLGSGLGFRFDQAGMTSMEVSSELTASVDTIGLIQGYSAAANSVYDIVNSKLVDHPATWVARTVGDISSYASAASNLNNAAGWDMMMGMDNTDTIRLYLASGSPAGYNLYDFNNGVWTVSGGAQAPAGVQLAKGDSWWVEYGTASSDHLEFTAEGFNSTAQDPPDMTGDTIVLVGETASGSAVYGWSHVIYGGSTRAINTSGLRDNLAAGDRIFVASPTGYFSSYYVGTDGNIYNFSGNLASLNLSSGYQVWVRNFAGDANWVIQ